MTEQDLKDIEAQLELNSGNINWSVLVIKELIGEVKRLREELEVIRLNGELGRCSVRDLAVVAKRALEEQ